MKPLKDYVNRTKSRKFKQRTRILYVIFIIPVAIALLSMLLSPAGESLRFFFTGLILGYVGQATLIYSLNAVDSFIKGNTNGI